MYKTTKIYVCILCTLFGLLSGCTIAEFYPNEGEWYCEELQLQLSFDDRGECFCIIGTEKIQCASGSDKGSRWLSVGCQEVNSEYYKLGEEVFSAEYVELSDDELIVREVETGIVYTFVKVDEK